MCVEVIQIVGYVCGGDTDCGLCVWRCYRLWVMCVEVIQIVGYVCGGDTDCGLCVWK